MVGAMYDPSLQEAEAGKGTWRPLGYMGRACLKQNRAKAKKTQLRGCRHVIPAWVVEIKEGKFKARRDYMRLCDQTNKTENTGWGRCTPEFKACLGK